MSDDVGHVQRNVGRLIEGRPRELRTPDESQRYCDAFRTTIRRVGRPVIVCADYRHIAVFPPFAADALRVLMTDMNELVERSAILVAPARATAALQVSRVVAESGHASRRRFDEKDALIAFLSQALTPEEVARMRVFLDMPGT